MSEDSSGLSNSDDDEPPEEIGENLPASINGDDEELQEVISENLPASFNRDNEGQHLVEDENQQGQSLRMGSPVSPTRHYSRYAVIFLLAAALIVLSVSWSEKTQPVSIKDTYAPCPRNWIGFGNKCFYFSEDLGNQTVSQIYCMSQSAQLAQFDNEEELNFLKRYK